MGKILKSSCYVGRHRKFYKTQRDQTRLQELELLKVKTRTDSLENLLDICAFHKGQYIAEFGNKFQKYSDPSNNNNSI